MKKTICLLFLAASLFAGGCGADPYPLELQQFDVFWTDADHSGTRTPGDILEVGFRVNTTNPNTREQFITDSELSFSVNGHFAGTLIKNQNEITNGLRFQTVIALDNLGFVFKPGDEVAFTFWVRDNWGTEVLRDYRFVFE